MPKALVFSVPAHGHINPSLPLVKELVGRGHEITYFTTEDYRPRVEATGGTVVDPLSYAVSSFATQARICAAIWSRTSRNFASLSSSLPSTAAGSSNGQCSFTPCDHNACGQC